MRRIFLLLIILIVAIIMFYLSRFWFLNLWPRGGLFGITELRPTGGLLARWVRGTPLAQFELLIWITGVFMILTFLQRVVDYIAPLTPSEEGEGPEA